MSNLDPRRVPVRPDLAASTLRGQVSAARFVDGLPRRIVVAATGLKSRPDDAAAYASEGLFGEPFTVYDNQNGWAWGRNESEGYVGWLRADHLGPPDPAPTHRVQALRTLIHPAPMLKSPPIGWLSLTSVVTVMTEENGYCGLAGGGFVFARHIGPLTPAGGDPVDTALRFLGTPYLWGGRSALGIDCSGLVQIALTATGHSAPRDSDMQAAEVGALIANDADPGKLALERGDLVFWPGHVAIMCDAVRVIHATAHSLSVTIEPLTAVAERGDPSGRGRLGVVRRLPITPRL